MPRDTAAPAKERRLTQPEMVLISFYRASNGTTNKVPYEEIVLQAWRDFPEAFSLRNHPEHPDASDIHKKLYQSLKSTGMIISLGNKVFRMTDRGISEATAILAKVERRTSAGGNGSTRLARSEENFIHHALRSRAFSTWIAGEHQRLVDYDARSFFQFGTATPAQERMQRLKFAQESIDKAKTLGIDQAADLRDLSEYLRTTFEGLFTRE